MACFCETIRALLALFFGLVNLFFLSNTPMSAWALLWSNYYFLFRCVHELYYVIITGLTGLMHLDLFGARITDSGTNYLRGMIIYPIVHKSVVFMYCIVFLLTPFQFNLSFHNSAHCLKCLIILIYFLYPSPPAFKKLRSLEICGGGLTDAGVKNIKDLTSLTLLNLSQNSLLTDKSLESISGMWNWYPCCSFHGIGIVIGYIIRYHLLALNSLGFQIINNLLVQSLCKMWQKLDIV